MRLAFIDVGSNSVRMLIADADGSKRDYFRRITRLAGARETHGMLSTESINRTLETLEEFRFHLNTAKVKKVTAVGTAALRNAGNAVDFVALALQQSGIQIDIIKGEREARLSCLGMLEVLTPVPESALLFDIGGGSTELILSQQKPEYQTSLELGAVRLLEDFADPYQRRDHISKILEPFFASQRWRDWSARNTSFMLVGTAGTVTTLAALRLNMREYDARRVNNQVVDLDWLQNIERTLKKLSPTERLKLAGMEKGREEIILPGIEVAIALLYHSGRNSFLVSDAGVLEGLLLESQQQTV